MGKTKTAPVSLSFAVQSLRAGGSLLINGFGGVNGLPLADIVIKKLRNADISFDYETKSLHFHHNPIQDGPTGFAYAIKNSTGESSPVWVEIAVEPGDTFPPAKRLPQNWQKALGAQAAWMVEEFTLDVEAEVSRRLRSKNIGDNQSSGISYTGAFINGNISFSSKLSSQVGDRLIFFIDGAPQSSITGIVDWKTLSFPVTAGIHTLTWYYQKDASGKAGEDSAWIDDLSLPLTADTLPSCSGLPAAWQTPAGMKEFKLTDLESKDGGCSLVSGNIGNKQASAMTLTADFQAGDLSFFSKVSSQLNADYLEFWLDDSRINTWSGKINWEQSSRTLTAGIHTLKFIYRKDAKLKADQDSAWIDNLILPQHDLRIFTLKASVESGMGTVDSKLWFSTDGQKLTLDYAPAADCKLAEAVMDGISLPIPEPSDLPGQLEIPALRKNSEVKLKFVKVNP